MDFERALEVLRELENLRVLARDAPYAQILELTRSLDLDRAATYDFL